MTDSSTIYLVEELLMCGGSRAMWPMSEVMQWPSPNGNQLPAETALENTGRKQDLPEPVIEPELDAA